MSNEKSINKRLIYLRNLVTKVSIKQGWWGSHVYRINGLLFLIMFKYSTGIHPRKDEDNNIIDKDEFFFAVCEKIVPATEIENLITEMKDIINDDNEYPKAKINKIINHYK